MVLVGAVMGQAMQSKRQMSKRERGVALLSVIVIIAVMTVTIADFSFNTTLDLAAASNSRDDLRAHYLSRSGVNLARLLLRVQQRVIDPNRKFLGGMDIQIADYAPILVSAFNSKEGADMLGSMFGVQGEIKGLGVDVGSFDLKMESLDGRLNLNCAGGTNPGSATVIRTASAMAAIMLPPRYNALFEEPDEDGQYNDRLSVMRAIIDWVDQDTAMFGTSSVEDYRYNTGKDRYENKNQYYDTVDELRLVKGVDDDFMSAFAKQLTVYGTCQVNVNLAEAPLITSVIIQHAATPNDPGLQWLNLALLSRYVVHIRDYYAGFQDLKSFTRAVEDPLGEAGSLFAAIVDADSGGAEPPALPPAQGVKLKQSTLSKAIIVGGPRRIWRITASSEVGRIKKKINAVWDMSHVSMQAKRVNMGPGGFLYWREE